MKVTCPDRTTSWVAVVLLLPRLVCFAVAYSAPVAAAMAVFLIYPIGQGSRRALNLCRRHYARHKLIYRGNCWKSKRVAHETSAIIRRPKKKNEAKERRLDRRLLCFRWSSIIDNSDSYARSPKFLIKQKP